MVFNYPDTRIGSLDRSAARTQMEEMMEPIKDASHLYEVERRARYAERPGFRISELQISATQQVPWHFHSNIQDTFYIIKGQVRLFLREPKEEVRLGPGDTYSVRPRRPHLVANGGMTPQRSSCFKASASTIMSRSWSKAWRPRRE